MDESTVAGLDGRIFSAAEAVSVVESGNRVFIGTACAAPRTLVQALESADRPLHPNPQLRAHVPH